MAMWDFLKPQQRRTRTRTWKQYHVESLKELRNITVHALCDYPLVLDLHWNPGYSLCTNPNECQGCKNKAPRRQKGYLPAFWHSRNKCIVIEMPEGALDELGVIGREHGGIKNVSLRFYKAPGKPNNPMHVAPEKEQVPIIARPALFDPRPVILLMYGYNSEQIEEAIEGMPLWLTDAE